MSDPIPGTDAPADELPVALEFLRGVWALAHALEARSKWMATHHGVTGPQRMTLRIIGRLPGVPAGVVARHLHLHPSTLTGVLQRLEERGFVARARDTSDSRRRIFVLTARGREADAQREGTVESAVERVLSRYGLAEIALVRRFLGELAEELAVPTATGNGSAESTQTRSD